MEKDDTGRVCKKNELRRVGNNCSRLQIFPLDLDRTLTKDKDFKTKIGKL